MLKDNIKNKEVEYISNLARLHLKNEDIKGLTSNLKDILNYIDSLKDLDTRDVAPTSHPLPVHDVFRTDEARPSLSQEEALRFSITHENGFFRVPQIIE